MGNNQSDRISTDRIPRCPSALICAYRYLNKMERKGAQMDADKNGEVLRGDARLLQRRRDQFAKNTRSAVLRRIQSLSPAVRKSRPFRIRSIDC
jgi:hypothetical protein